MQIYDKTVEVFKSFSSIIFIVVHPFGVRAVTFSDIISLISQHNYQLSEISYKSLW